MQLLTYKGAEPRAMMQRIIAEHGSSARVVSLKEGRYGGIFGFFAKQGFILTVEVDERVHMPKVHRDLPAAEPVTFAETMTSLDTPRSTEEFVSQLAEQTKDIFEVEGATVRPQTFDDALESVTASLGTDPIAFAQEWADLIRTSDHPSATPDVIPLSITPMPNTLALNTPDPNTPVANTPGPNTPIQFVSETKASEGGETFMQLRTAGYPLALLAELMGTGVGNVSLEHAFAIVRQAPTLPRTPGSLVAIVGPTERAIELATQIAVELKTDPSDVAIVTNDASFLGSKPLPAVKAPVAHQRPATTARSPQRAVTTTRKRGPASRVSRPPFGPGLVAHDVEAAVDLMPGWRRDRVGVVVVACEASVMNYPWVRTVLRGIMPSFVYLATRASSKSDDIRQTAQRIGGADAILLDGLNESMTPLSALSLEIPIARLDGKVADPQSWASVVTSLPSTTPEY